MPLQYPSVSSKRFWRLIVSRQLLKLKSLWLGDLKTFIIALFLNIFRPSGTIPTAQTANDVAKSMGIDSHLCTNPPQMKTSVPIASAIKTRNFTNFLICISNRDFLFGCPVVISAIWPIIYKKIYIHIFFIIGEGGGFWANNKNSLSNFGQRDKNTKYFYRNWWNTWKSLRTDIFP